MNGLPGNKSKKPPKRRERKRDPMAKRKKKEPQGPKSISDLFEDKTNRESIFFSRESNGAFRRWKAKKIS